MATFDPTRLYSTLLNTGLQVKDNALYQVIHDLIAALATINKQTNAIASSSSSATVTNIIQQLTEITDFGFEEFQIPNINSSVTNVVNNVNNTIQQISGDSSSDFSALEDFQIPGPIGPPGPMVPYHIGINEVFLVPLYKQALFAMNIDNEGIIEVDGFLIEVDGIPNSVASITQLNFGDDSNIEDIPIRNISTIDLTDYQTGTWTPVIGGATSESGQTYSLQAGHYVKVGPFVWTTFRVSLSAAGTITGAPVQIKGLPFPILSGVTAGSPISYFAGLATNWTFVGGIINAGSQAALFGTQGVATGLTQVAPADIGNLTDLIGSIVYRTGF